MINSIHEHLMTYKRQGRINYSAALIVLGVDENEARVAPLLPLQEACIDALSILNKDIGYLIRKYKGDLSGLSATYEIDFLIDKVVGTLHTCWGGRLNKNIDPTVRYSCRDYIDTCVHLWRAGGSKK